MLRFNNHYAANETKVKRCSRRHRLIRHSLWQRCQ